MKWIKITDRLPENEAKVIVKDAEGNVNQLFHHENNDYYLMSQLFGVQRYAITDIVEWIDESEPDFSNELFSEEELSSLELLERGFNAAREKHFVSKYAPSILKYENFTQYKAYLLAKFLKPK